MEIKEFYAQSLNVRHPWQVTQVAILDENRAVEVLVESSEKSKRPI